ncbi:MAG: LemA family protein [Patescibacteria group bacterium]|nr:LemA family protein [Patescibacteria group bacterium]
MSKTIQWVAGIIIVLALVTYTNYNSLVTGDEQATTSFAQIETQLQRRFDLIPNLVNAVKGNMAQETEIFGAISEARTKYANATSSDDKVAAANQVEGTLGRLLAIMENYPNLRSSEAVQNLMTQLEGTENRISVSRQDYNQSVQNYNLKVRRFPSSIFAKIFGFDLRTKFEATEGAEKVPEVKLK